jgi:hypothetical protein
MSERDRGGLSKKEMYDLAICASAGDTEAMKELYERGLYPISGQLAQWGLKMRYKWLYGEFPPDESLPR